MLKLTTHKKHKNWLSGVSTLAVGCMVGMTPASAQYIKIEGSNYSYTGGCPNGTVLNSSSSAASCLPNGGPLTPIINEIADYSATTPIWVQPNYNSSGATNGLLIGSHRTNMLGNTGNMATGSFEISGGARVNSNLVYIGYEDNTSGEVVVTGPDTHWHTFGTVSVGHHGNGKLTISDGGVMDATYDPYIYVGYGAGASGEVVISGTSGMNRSSFLTGNQVHIGEYGTGKFSVLDGGYSRFKYTSVIGTESGSTGSVHVDGVGTLSDGSYVQSEIEVANNQFRVGHYGSGLLDVTNGGLVNVNQYLILAGRNIGIANIDGVHGPSNLRSTISAGAGFIVGYGPHGELNITNGGLATSQSASTKTILYVGREADSGPNGGGVVNIDGVGHDGTSSSLQILTGIVGEAGTGALNVTGGGSASFADLTLLNPNAPNLSLGAKNTGVGYLNISGEDASTGLISRVNVDGNLKVGELGTGVVNLSDKGRLTTDSIDVALGSGAKGTINIGVGGRSGTLNAPVIAGGLGDATVNFNHIDDLDFTPVMTGNLKVNQINSGATTLAVASNYSGLTTISAGALKAGGANFLSANSDHQVDQFGMLDLNGFGQTLSNLDNGGLVRFGGNGGTILEVTDTYTGNGGVIEFNTVLGDDASLTDKMTAQETTGTSLIRVRNAGGAGAQTNEGIQIIEVGDALSTGTFSLLGDYVFEGDQAVVGGAYAYRLYQGAASAPNDGNWYLRSALIPTDPEVPLYQPGVPIYESYAQSLLGLNGLNTLQQRVGNRYWAGNGNRVIAQGADTPQYYAPAEEAGTYSDGNGIWGRIEGAHNKLDPKFSSSGADYSQNIFRMQAGADMLLSENMDGMLIGGVFAHYAHGKTKVRSIYGDGTISTNGYGLGGSLTWYGNQGFYVDGQAQATWYNSDLASTLASTGLVSGNKGFGYALSLETGKRFAITPEWSVTPQAQLSYSNVRFDGFDDVWGAHVSLDRGSSFQGRLGVTLDYETSWQNAAGMTDRAHIYGIANLYYGFTNGTKVNVANTQFAQEQERLWGGLGVGGSYNWNDDKYSIYGEGLVNTSLNSFGDSYTLKGNIGLRVKW